MQNIGMQDSLLSRFDLVFILLDTVDLESDRLISDHVVRVHRYRYFCPLQFSDLTIQKCREDTFYKKSCFLENVNQRLAPQIFIDDIFTFLVYCLISHFADIVFIFQKIPPFAVHIFSPIYVPQSARSPGRFRNIMFWEESYATKRVKSIAVMCIYYFN